MPRRLNLNLPKVDLDFLRKFLSQEAYEGLLPHTIDAPSVARNVEPPVKAPSIFDEMRPLGIIDDPFSPRQPIPGRDPLATTSDVSFQTPVDPEIAEEALRLPAVQEASARIRANQRPIPTLGQPPPDLVDRLKPWEHRAIKEGIGSAGVQKMMGAEGGPEFGEDLPASTWSDVNEHDLRFREATARRQAELKALDRGVYDFDHGPGAWQREWDKTLVRPTFPRAQEVMETADPSIEDKLNDPRNALAGIDAKAIPPEYNAVNVPEGRGYTVNDTIKAGMKLPDEDASPTSLPTLGKVTQTIRRITGTGEVEDQMPSKVPWTPAIEEKVKLLENEARFDRSLLQPVWDRTHGTYFRDEAKAEAEFLNFLDGILQPARIARLRRPEQSGVRFTEYSRDLAPEERYAQQAHDQAMASFTELRGFAPGVQSQGFAEREKKIDLGDNYSQLNQEGARELTSGEGFQGSQGSGADRDEFGRGTLRTLDESSKNAVGQNPLQALRKKNGAVLDQVENLRKGLVDLAIVPRGTVQVGHNRFGEPGLDPYQTEVLKVIPFNPSMKPGYLEMVSRRLLLPTETLADVVEASRASHVEGMEVPQFDIIQVRKPRGKVGRDLPDERWTRTPETLNWHAGEKGQQAQERLKQHPLVQDLILNNLQGSVSRTVAGRGKLLLGVIYIKGKPIGVGQKDPRTGRYRFYRMTVDEAAGQPTFRYEPEGPKRGQPYGGKPVAPNLLENELVRSTSVLQSPEEARFYPKGHPKYIDPSLRNPTVDEGPAGLEYREATSTTYPVHGETVWEPQLRGRAEDTALDARGRPLLEEQLEASQPNFNRGIARDAVPNEGKPVVPQEVWVDPKNHDLGKRLESMEEAKARVLAIEPDVRTKVEGAGFQLTPVPIRYHVDQGIRWALFQEPRKYDKGYARGQNKTQSWPISTNPENAQATLVFTARTPNKTNPNKVADYAARPGELVNPTAEDVRYLLQHSDITRVVVRVEEPDGLADSQNLWHRVHAVTAEAVNSREGKPSYPLQKAGNPNWKVVGKDAQGQPIYAPVTGEALPPTAPVDLKGGPAMLGGAAADAEASRIALAGKANTRKTPSPRMELPESRGALTPEEIQARIEERGNKPITLYRVEVKPSARKAPAEWIQQSQEELGIRSAAGRWFFADPKLAQFYINDIGAKNARIVKVQMTKAEADQYRVSLAKAEDKVNPKLFSRDPENEFFLPPDVASAAVEGNLPAAPVPKSSPRGFMDAVRAMHQKKGEAIIREAFPGQKFGTGGGWGRKAWMIGGSAVGATLLQQMVPGENKAEAAAGRALKVHPKIDASEAARVKMSTSTSDYVPEFMREWMTKHLNFFEPIYDSANQKIGKEAEQALRDRLGTQHGGIVGQAQIRYEPIKLMREKFDEAGQTENFTFFLKKAMNLKSWDNALRQKQALEAQAVVERSKGNGRAMRALEDQVRAIDDQMANRTLTEFNGNKDTEINELRQLHDTVGPETYAAFQRGAGIIYRQTQQMIDTLHAEGQIPDAEYAEIKARGVDYIPNVATLFALGDDGKFRWTGGKHIKSFKVDQTGVPAKEVLQTRFNDNILADPLTSVARFITESTAQIARTKMAQKVVDVFEGIEMAKQVDPNKNPTPALGNDFYTFMREGKPVTYEMPKHLIDSLGMADQDFTNRFIQNLPGAKTLGSIRSISEAGSTTANLGWAMLQSTIYDPVAAIMQLPSKDRRIARRMIPFMGSVLKNIKDNLATANRGKASSPLRQKAAERNILFAGSAADLADYSQIEGRDTSNRKGINNQVRKGLGVISDRLAKPLDEAVKMASYDMMVKERAKGLNTYSDEQIESLVRTRGGSGDWNQRGSQDDWVRTLISFGRPTMIANETALRSGWQQPRKLANVLITMTAAEAARQGMNSFAAKELGIPQEELEKRYSKYDQDNSMIIMVPPSWAASMNNGEGVEIGSNGIERPFAVKIPIPPLLRVWTSPMKGLAKAYQTGDWKDAVVGTPVGIIDELAPGSVPLRYDTLGNAAGAVGRRIGSVLPAVYRLPIEQYADKQFFTGAPIVGSRLQDREAPEQYSASTDPFYRALGRTTGMSPNRLQHLGRGLAPGMFQLPAQLYNKTSASRKDAEGNVIAPVEQSPIERVNAIPVLGELTKRLTPQRYEEDLSSAQDQFYGLSQQTKSAAAGWNDFEEGVTLDRPSTQSQYLAALNPDVQGLVRELSELSDYQKMIINSGTMTPPEKRDKIRDIMTVRRNTLRQFLAVPQIRAAVGGVLPDQ